MDKAAGVLFYALAGEEECASQRVNSDMDGWQLRALFGLNDGRHKKLLCQALHAGVKGLRDLIDRYKADEITIEDKAAYRIQEFENVANAQRDCCWLTYTAMSADEFQNVFGESAVPPGSAVGDESGETDGAVGSTGFASDAFMPV